ncbi:hypothetical protein [Bacillus phage Hyb1phi3Ts-SPbeta]|nr:hypothetical protein [Bacillus phage phi3Ts]QNN96962.1 hypothetical protein [Bacillus phage Hyb2phi3Ts-SPbeta]QNN97147.1 hypothetical protein [Bacillus phage Hyb3phi3Ts-SPbeta]QNR51679.1 hypothetical protein [Bacillus phage Hyb1phi3Ts-SPbeta]
MKNLICFVSFSVKSKSDKANKPNTINNIQAVTIRYLSSNHVLLWQILIYSFRLLTVEIIHPRTSSGSSKSISFCRTNSSNSIMARKRSSLGSLLKSIFFNLGIPFSFIHSRKG